jgi:membrane dipeptidase
MRFFDAHCDTVMHTMDGGLDFISGQGRAHMDLPRLLAVGSCVQLFAVFTARRSFPGVDLAAYADQCVATIRGWVGQSDGRMRLALTAADVAAAAAGKSFYGMLGLEGADCAGERAEGLEHFIDLGVRNVIPAWDDNAFSGTVFGNQGPLTDEGRKLIELCEARRVMVDVSHLSDTAFWQVHEMTHRPFIASHSNCRAVSPSPRNLTDDMICALAARGGVMGINLAADFLDPDFFGAGREIIVPRWEAMLDEKDPVVKERLQAELKEIGDAIPLPSIDIVARQVRHAIDVGGEGCIGLGGDLDGIDHMPAGMTGIESYPLIVEALARTGLSEAQIEKVCWRNMARVFTDVLA